METTPLPSPSRTESLEDFPPENFDRFETVGVALHL